MAPERLIHVVDDDPAARESLAFLFESDGWRVEAHASGDALLQRGGGLVAGCIVTDVRMPGMSGLDLLSAIREVSRTVPVILVTGHGDVPMAVEAMKRGATDFIEKPFDDATMLRIVTAAVGRLADVRAAEAESEAVRRRLAQLSPRERQVLDGLVAGQPNKQIAYDLSISPRTVEIYRAHVMTKMEAGSLSELVRMTIAASGGR